MGDNMKYLQSQKEDVKKKLVELYHELEQAQEALRVTKNTEKSIKDEIHLMFAIRIDESVRSKNSPFGTVNFVEDGLKVTFVTPKNVSYDQDGLKKLLDDGAPVDVEYSVNENTYKSLNQAGQDCFDKYRTVKPGSVQVKIERVTE
jgi:hypothetical protein